MSEPSQERIDECIAEVEEKHRPRELWKTIAGGLVLVLPVSIGMFGLAALVQPEFLKVMETSLPGGVRGALISILVLGTGVVAIAVPTEHYHKRRVEMRGARRGVRYYWK